MSFALGELRLKPWEFWELTWVEFVYMRDGFFKLQEYEWLHTRHVIATIMNKDRGKGKPVRPQDIIELSFDKHTKEIPKEYKKYYSKEEATALYKRLGLIPKNGKHS